MYRRVTPHSQETLAALPAPSPSQQTIISRDKDAQRQLMHLCGAFQQGPHGGRTRKRLPMAKGTPQLQETQCKVAHCSVTLGLTWLGLEPDPYAAAGGEASRGLVLAEPFSPLSLQHGGAGTARADPCQQGTLWEEPGTQPKQGRDPLAFLSARGGGCLMQAVRTCTWVLALARCLLPEQELSWSWARGCRHGSCEVGWVGCCPCVSTL